MKRFVGIVLAILMVIGSFPFAPTAKAEGCTSVEEVLYQCDFEPGELTGGVNKDPKTGYIQITDSKHHWQVEWKDPDYPDEISPILKDSKTGKELSVEQNNISSRFWIDGEKTGEFVAAYPDRATTEGQRWAFAGPSFFYMDNGKRIVGQVKKGIEVRVFKVFDILDDNAESVRVDLDYIGSGTYIGGEDIWIEAQGLDASGNPVGEPIKTAVGRPSEWTKFTATFDLSTGIKQVKVTMGGVTNEYDRNGTHYYSTRDINGGLDNLTITKITPAYSVTFENPEVEGDPTVQCVKKGTVPTAPSATEVEDKTFDGWYHGDTKLEDDGPITSEKTYTAVYKDKTPEPDPVPTTCEAYTKVILDEDFMNSSAEPKPPYDTEEHAYVQYFKGDKWDILVTNKATGEPIPFDENHYYIKDKTQRNLTINKKWVEDLGGGNHRYVDVPNEKRALQGPHIKQEMESLYDTAIFSYYRDFDLADGNPVNGDFTLDFHVLYISAKAGTSGADQASVGIEFLDENGQVMERGKFDHGKTPDGSGTFTDTWVPVDEKNLVVPEGAVKVRVLLRTHYMRGMWLDAAFAEPKVTVHVPSYQVVFKDSDGTELSNKCVPFGEPIMPPGDPSQDGKDFTGWVDGENNPIPTDGIVTGNQEFTATYKDKPKPEGCQPVETVAIDEKFDTLPKDWKETVKKPDGSELTEKELKSYDWDGPRLNNNADAINQPLVQGQVPYEYDDRVVTYTTHDWNGTKKHKHLRHIYVDGHCLVVGIFNKHAMELKDGQASFSKVVDLKDNTSLDVSVKYGALHADAHPTFGENFGGDNVYVELVFLNDANNQVGEPVRDASYNDGKGVYTPVEPMDNPRADWMLFEQKDVKIPEGATKAELRLVGVIGTAWTVNAYFDDVKLVLKKNSHEVVFKDYQGKEYPQCVTEGENPKVPDTIKDDDGNVPGGWLDEDGKIVPNPGNVPVDKNKVYIPIHNVIPQEGEHKPENVPDDYVPVTMDPTDKGKLQAGEPKVYWVNPKAEVTIPAKDAVGITVGGVEYTFEKWDEELTQTFTGATTITAKYSREWIPITPIPPVTPETVITPVGDQPTEDQYREKLKNGEDPIPADATIEVLEEPDVSKEGNTTAKLKITYKDGSSITVAVPVVVVPHVIPQEGEDKPEGIPDTYVQVIMDPAVNGTLPEGTPTIYWVKPEVEVTIPCPDAEGTDPNQFIGWDAMLTDTFTEPVTTITALYVVPDNITQIQGDDPVTKNEINETFEVPDGFMITEVTIPDTYSPDTPGEHKVTVTVIDKDGNKRNIIVTIHVIPNVIPGDGPDKPEGVPENFVKVTMVPTAKGSLQPGEPNHYWVAPDRQVTIPAKDAVGGEFEGAKWIFIGWDKPLINSFPVDTYITAKYDPAGGWGEPYVPSRPEPAPTPKPTPEKPVDVFEDTTKDEPKDEDTDSLGELERHELYIIGHVDGTFGPEMNITRAEVATIFARIMSGQVLFHNVDTRYPDVKADHWASGAIAYVTERGIFEGRPDGTFGPQVNITRAEYATIVARYKGIMNGTPRFSDVAGHWAENYIYACGDTGIVTGYEDGSFKPNQPITRAEAVAMTNRMLNRVGDKTYLLSNLTEEQIFPDVAPTYWAYAHIYEASTTHYFRRNADQTETWHHIEDWGRFYQERHK